MVVRPKASGNGRELRRGWTTGSCATAAATAAFEALLGARFPDPLSITSPGGRIAFALAEEELGPGFARASVVKGAGDDPDVTHGAVIAATVRLASAGTGLAFLAGSGLARRRGPSERTQARIRSASTAAEAFALCEGGSVPLGPVVAEAAWHTAAAALGPGILLDILMVDRAGQVVTESSPRPTASR